MAIQDIFHHPARTRRPRASRCMPALAVVLAALFLTTCDTSEGSVSCSDQCPDGTRRASYSETSSKGRQAILDGQAFLTSTARCETLCEAVQPCLYPNVPTVGVEEESGEVTYRCDPLEGYTKLMRDHEVDLAFAEGWTPPAPTPALSTHEVEFGYTNTAVAAADVNGDGQMDLVGVYDGTDPSPGVGVLLGGNGDDVFRAPWTFDLPNKIPRAVAAGDLDGDGDDDVVVATSVGAAWTLSTMTAEGDGTLGSPEAIWEMGEAGSIALGDVNADGYPDLVWVDIHRSNDRPSAPDGLAVVLNDGAGGLTGSAIGLDQEGCANLRLCGTGPFTVRDLDGDGDADIAATVKTGELVVHWSNGDGTFSTDAARPLARKDIAAVVAGDFDDDGNADILVLRADDATALWFRGSGEHDFEVPTTLNHGLLSTYGVAEVGDIDGDGRDDVVLAGPHSDDFETPPSLLVWFSDGAGGLGRKLSSPWWLSGNAGIAVGDFDGDGVDDAAAPGFHAVLVVLGGAP